MPLRDHFPKPDEPEYVWESFHGAWANSLMAQLNRTLPKRFRAYTQIHLSRYVEADIAEIDRGTDEADESRNGPGGGVAVRPWAPPAASIVVPALFPDDLVVPILDTLHGGINPVAVIELVSPRNKDRDASRRAFAVKSAAYLQRGLGLLMVDIVGARHANLHNELMKLNGHSSTTLMPDDVWLYAAAYRPARIEEINKIEIWSHPLTLGEILPVLPLALRGAMTVPVDLESSYGEAWERSGF